MIDGAGLPASGALSAMASGELSAVDLLESCLAAIARHDATIRAFCHVDVEAARAEARLADARRTEATATGEGPGLLCGVPVAIKDVIDVRGMPTGHGVTYRAPRIAERDARVVALLRRQGAVIVGKTETVAFAAAGAVPPTRNPRDPARSPGGSSSGSAAAVAAGMVPLAIGTQTGGSQIRPAAFTGIYALKPTFGTVAREGMSPFAPSLDTIGWFARSVDDLSLLLAALAAPDPMQETRVPAAGRVIGICRGPHWAGAAPDMQLALLEAERRLRRAGMQIRPVDLPASFDALTSDQEVVMYGEGHLSLRDEHVRHGAALHPDLAAIATNARGIGRADIWTAAARISRCRTLFDGLFGPRLDAILAPGAPGEAPSWADGTGSSRFNKMWSALHAPCVALPGFSGSSGLPLGLQLVGPRFGDADLLACATAVDRILNG